MKGPLVQVGLLDIIGPLFYLIEKWMRLFENLVLLSDPAFMGLLMGCACEFLFAFDIWEID